MKPFNLIPFFRILFPFSFGITIGIFFNTPVVVWFYLALLLIPLTFFNFYKAGRTAFRRLFILSADLFLVIFGLQLVNLKNNHIQHSFYGNLIQSDSLHTVIGVLDELPELKNNHVKGHLKLISLRVNGDFKPITGSSIAYFHKSSQTLQLKAGQALLIRTRFLDIPSPKNPNEFDYRNYLHHKQIYHTFFLDSNAFECLQTQSSLLNPIWHFGLMCKAHILTTLKNSGLSQNAYSICAALLTGYDQEIEKPVIEAFSHSGTLHVLSVSGLHTGLIYLMLTYLLDVFDKKRKFKSLRFLFVTVVLWSFALITGFSAPVLRSVIMFNLLGAGKIFFRNQLKNQINILCVSAFLLLVNNPYFILDVGFQLSYFAMFGLLYFQPKFVSLWQPEQKWQSYIWESVCASFAATVSTLPITLFYFKQLPLWFFVCNIVVVPATFVLLIGSLVLLFKIPFVSLILNTLVEILIRIIMLFNQEGITYVDAIHFTWVDSLFLSLLIILLSTTVLLRSHKYLVLSLSALICWQIIALSSSLFIKTKSQLSIYQLKNNSCIAIKNKTDLVYQINSASGFNYSVKPHFIALNYPKTHQQIFNCVQTDTETFILLNHTNKLPILKQSRHTNLIISNNFNLNEKDLQSFPNLTAIICDGSNNRKTAFLAEKLSRKFGLTYYDTKQSGAYVVSIK